MRQTQCPNFCAAVGVRHLTFSVNATFMKQLDKNKIGMSVVLQHDICDRAYLEIKFMNL